MEQQWHTIAKVKRVCKVVVLVLVLVIKPVGVKERGWVHWGRAERLRPFPGIKHAVKRKKKAKQGMHSPAAV